MMSAAGDSGAEAFRGKRVALLGPLASMTRREAERMLRRLGAVVVEKPDASTHLVVVGEGELPLPELDLLDAWFDEPARKAVEQGTLEIVAETQWLERLGLADHGPEGDRLYTPAMLAELLGVPVATIRSWHRRGLITGAQEVRRLPYFDFQEVATARRLAQLLAAGVAPKDLQRKLAALARLLPGVRRPLAQTSVTVDGQNILLRHDDGLIEAGGQLHFDFDTVEDDGGQLRFEFEPVEGAEPATPAIAAPQLPSGESTSPEELRRMAAELEEAGELAAAAEMHRAIMAALGPDAETCFQLAELLYRLGDLSAARERYYTVIELDEDYVEARANLGCVLAELGQRDLAVAAFEGALRYHGGYADVYYHLARTLDDMGRRSEAEARWRTFLAMAPDSPWADEARGRLEK